MKKVMTLITTVFALSLCSLVAVAAPNNANLDPPPAVSPTNAFSEVTHDIEDTELVLNDVAVETEQDQFAVANPHTSSWAANPNLGAANHNSSWAANPNESALKPSPAAPPNLNASLPTSWATSYEEVNGNAVDIPDGTKADTGNPAGLAGAKGLQQFAAFTVGGEWGAALNDDFIMDIVDGTALEQPLAALVGPDWVANMTGGGHHALNPDDPLAVMGNVGVADHDPLAEMIRTLDPMFSDNADPLVANSNLFEAAASNSSSAAVTDYNLDAA